MKGLLIGKSPGHKKVYLTPRDLKNHVHVVGGSGRGKSKYIEACIRQHIVRREGFCFIDPAGNTYNNILRWLAHKEGQLADRKEKVLLFDPNDEDWAFCFNPLQRSTKEITDQADAMLRAVAKVWGGTKTLDETPLLKRNLRAIFHVLIEKERSLLDAAYLISDINPDIRKLLTQDIEEEFVKDLWKFYSELRRKDRDDMLGSAMNRLQEFLMSGRLRRIFGQRSASVNFRKLMDEGYFFLVNLAYGGGNLSEENASTLGALLINDLFLHAQSRPEESEPFYLYIDEFSLYVNEDIQRIIDEGRKRGLYLTIAHQHLAQLKEKNPLVYATVMGDIENRVVLGKLGSQDAALLADEVFRYNLDEIIYEHEMISLVGHHWEWKTSYHEQHSSGEFSSGGGSIATPGMGTSNSQQYLPGGGVGPSTRSTSRPGPTNTSTDQSGHQETHGEGTTRGAVLVPDMSKQITSVTFGSKEYHQTKAADSLRDQPIRHAWVKRPLKDAVPIEIVEVKPHYATKEITQKFKEECNRLTDAVRPREAAEKEIEAGRQELLKLLKTNDDDYVPPPKPRKAISKEKKEVPKGPKRKR